MNTNENKILDKIYIVQAYGFGEGWENVAAFSTEEAADSYRDEMRGKSHPDFADNIRTVPEAFNPAFPYRQ